MKIYTEINYIWSEEEGKLVETSSKSYEYSGPMTLCHERKLYGANIPHSHKNYYESLFGAKDEGEDPAATEAAYQAWLKGEKEDAKAALDKTFLKYDLDDPDFKYGDSIRKKYMDFAMDSPITGIRPQRKKALGDLVAALNRQGLEKSSVAVNREALAKKLYADAQVKAALTGDQTAKGVQKNLINLKSEALDAINASSDPGSEGSMTATSAALATDPGKFSAMHDVFAKLTEGLLVRQEVEQRKRQNDLYKMYFPQYSGSGKIIP